MGNTPSRDWRKKSHRLQKGRDEFKARNREKAVQIKALQIKASDVEESRYQWKKKCEEKTREIKRLEDEVAAKNELIEAEKRLRKQEAEAHAEELDGLKKNGRCCSNAPRRKRLQNLSPTLFGSFCLDIVPIGSRRGIKPSRSSSCIRSMLFLAPT